MCGLEKQYHPNQVKKNLLLSIKKNTSANSLGKKWFDIFSWIFAISLETLQSVKEFRLQIPITCALSSVLINVNIFAKYILKSSNWKIA